MITFYFFDIPLFLFICVTALTLFLDALWGDPPWLYKRIPHPVVLIGSAIAFGERLLNQKGGTRSKVKGILLGAILSVIIITLATGLGLGVTLVADGLIAPGSGGLDELLAVFILGLLCSSLLALRSLGQAVEFVAKELSKSLAQGRAAVRHLVARDPESLDESGISRAAIESMAENFSDGFVAPLFWFCLFGPLGLMFYKAVNTLDSMIGYRNERYEDFGKFAARLDDVVNYIPARLAGCFFVLAAFFHPKANGAAALITMLRDAKKHRSPNAGWQEAAVAGALNFALAGPRHYDGYSVDDPYIGGGNRRLTAKNIREALMLYYIAVFFTVLTTMTGLTVARLFPLSPL